MKIVRMKLTPDDFSSPGLRWDATCDCVQISVDGGSTWTDDPGADPRTNPAYLLPPNTEPDVKCAAAAGMVKYVHDVVDAAIDGTSAAGIANAILAIGIAFLPIAPLFALIYAVVDALLVITGAVLEANFTTTVYEQLLCIFDCNVDADGRLDAAGMDAVLEDCSTIIGNLTVQSTMELLVQLVGFVGFSNAGSKNADAGADCDECLCEWCVKMVFSEGAGAFVTNWADNSLFDAASWDGTHWAGSTGSSPFNGGTYGFMHITFEERTITYVRFQVGNGYNYPNGFFFTFQDEVNQAQTTLLDHVADYGWTGSYVATAVNLGAQNDAPGSDLFTWEFEMHGLGTVPPELEAYLC